MTTSKTENRWGGLDYTTPQGTIRTTNEDERLNIYCLGPAPGETYRWQVNFGFSDESSRVYLAALEAALAEIGLACVNGRLCSLHRRHWIERGRDEEIRSMTDDDVAKVIDEYDRLVRLNTTPQYDALAAVAEDKHGEAAFEVLDVAYGLGFREQTDADSDALCDAFEDYRATIASEI